MEITLSEFHAEVEEVQKSGKTRRYPKAMKDFAVEYGLRRMNEGATRATCVSELRIADGTFSAWMKGFRVSVKRNNLGTGESDGSITMISPRGFRFENLSVEEASRLALSLRND